MVQSSLIRSEGRIKLIKNEWPPQKYKAVFFYPSLYFWMRRVEYDQFLLRGRLFL
jgi:hypothetical protein